jgi:hypothetical protein
MPSAIAHIATIGARYASGRHAQRPQPRVLLHQQRPVLGQVAGQEDDQDDLEQLGRLAAERPELEGQALAVDLGAEDEREQQQPTPTAAHVYL